jgi:ketosteroid isomerase-like protein
MMSSTNVDLLRQLQFDGADFVELFEGGPADLPPDALSVLAPDFEVRFVPASVGERPSYRGLEGFLEGWQDWLTPWASYHLEVEDFIEVGDDTVVTLARVHAKTERDGVAVEHAPAAVWTFEGGKVVRIEFYLEREEAFEAAGLDPSRRERSAS